MNGAVALAGGKVERGTPNKVHGVIPFTMMGVASYNDAEGISHEAMIAVADGKVFVIPEEIWGQAVAVRHPGVAAEMSAALMSASSSTRQKPTEMPNLPDVGIGDAKPLGARR
jgi:hypothetical protein